MINVGRVDRTCWTTGLDALITLGGLGTVAGRVKPVGVAAASTMGQQRGVDDDGRDGDSGRGRGGCLRCGTDTTLDPQVHRPARAPRDARTGAGDSR